ncbi:MAG TPA: aminotransferase class I/II-fold pyridoxal phosphate-dependent enzyme [Terriglobia bacterium]|nr:aminotransferase class I/II-fold pyridoxal phosphate-dependent enzyme [Terriglobia bacterium]
MIKRPQQLETKLIHAGDPLPRIKGAVNLPIFQSANFEYSAETEYHDVRYIRLNNTPNHEALHIKLAALENAEAALVAASGMAAISTTLLTLLSAGDHMLIQDCVYGGTHQFVTQDLGAFGISYDFIDANQPSTWAKLVRPSTRVLYVETMSNPLLQTPDLEAAVRFASRHKLASVVDNTFASPVNFRPAEWGFDLSLHSGTKYLNGHSDIVAGAVIGRANLVTRIKRRLDHLGGSLDPHAAFLLYRGMKTLAVRMAYQNASAATIARFLEKRPEVERVYYPGGAQDSGRKRARKLFNGFGGVLSFELRGGMRAARRFIGRVTLPIVAPSLGGVESLITRPCTTSHAGMSPQDRKRAGISDSLIRLSVGVEATSDLIEDLESALSAV